MKNYLKSFGILFLTSLFLFSCQPKVNLEKEKKDIMDYLELAKKANIESDYATWTSLYAKNCVYVMNGEVKNYTRDEIEKLSKESFENSKVKYTSIEDLSEPIIHISNDGTMAWYIVNSKFNYTYTDSLGNEQSNSAEGASLFILEKEDGKWVEVTGFNSGKPKKK